MIDRCYISGTDVASSQEELENKLKENFKEATGFKIEKISDWGPLENFQLSTHINNTNQEKQQRKLN